MKHFDIKIHLGTAIIGVFVAAILLYVNIVPLRHPFTSGWPYKFRHSREDPPNPDDAFDIKTDLVIGIPVNTAVDLVVVYFVSSIFQSFYYGRAILKKLKETAPDE